LPMLVRTVGPAWMDEIFAVRLEVGSLIAAQAAQHATADHRARLRELLAELSLARDAQLAECEIHRMIAASTGNRVYGFLVNSMLNAYLEIRDLFQHAFADPRVAAERITPLIEAIESGDPGRAHAASHSYLSTTRELMLG
ncbi:MAG: FCD domain-containing protein, partial [Streptosporangiaceae bacterium]